MLGWRHEVITHIHHMTRNVSPSTQASLFFSSCVSQRASQVRNLSLSVGLHFIDYVFIFLSQTWANCHVLISWREERRQVSCLEPKAEPGRSNGSLTPRDSDVGSIVTPKESVAKVNRGETGLWKCFHLLLGKRKRSKHLSYSKPYAHFQLHSVLTWIAGKRTQKCIY